MEFIDNMKAFDRVNEKFWQMLLKHPPSVDHILNLISAQKWYIPQQNEQMVVCKSVGKVYPIWQSKIHSNILKIIMDP